MRYLATATGLRAAILAILGFLGIVFPGLIPDDARETVADYAVQMIGAVLGIWALFAAHRAKKQSEGAEASRPRGL